MTKTSEYNKRENEDETERWWFVLEDIVLTLTDSNDIKQYINKMRQRDKMLNEAWVQIVHTLSIQTEGGQ